VQVLLDERDEVEKIMEQFAENPIG